MTQDRKLQASRGGVKPSVLLFVLVVAVVATILFLGREEPTTGKAIGPWEAVRLDGSVVQTWSDDGTYVVDFWGTWCPPCLRELPEVAALAREWRPRGVRFLAVEVGGSTPAQVAAFARNPRYSGLEFAIGKDLDAIFRGLGRDSIPQTLIVHDGKIVEHYTGYSPGLPAAIRRRLAELTRQDAAPGGATDAAEATSPGSADAASR